MRRSWRSESFALLGLWASATALLVAASRLPHRAVAVAPLARAVASFAAPPRRPPVARSSSVAAPAVVEAPGEVPAPEGDPATTPEVEPAVEVTELEAIDIVGYSDGWFDEPEPYDANLEEYRWQYRWRSLAGRWSRYPRYRYGDSLRPAAPAFLAAGPVPSGLSGDPCGVLPGACTNATQGGAFDPPTVLAPLRASDAEPAVVTRDGDRWTLSNARLSLAIDARCQVVARRPDDAMPTVVNFAAPPATECVRRGTAAPWGDRAGAAIELAWSAAAGSMRVVVALADDGDGAEASVARTHPSGETWLTNMGKTALTWTIGGREVTVGAGAAVRVSAGASRGDGPRGSAAAPPGARSSSRS